MCLCVLVPMEVTRFWTVYTETPGDNGQRRAGADRRVSMFVCVCVRV